MRVTRSSVGNEIAAKKDHVSHRIPPYGCEPGTITTVDSDLHSDAGRKQSDAQLQLFTSPDSFPVSIERRRQITERKSGGRRGRFEELPHLIRYVLPKPDLTQGFRVREQLVERLLCSRRSPPQNRELGVQLSILLKRLGIRRNPCQLRLQPFGRRPGK